MFTSKVWTNDSRLFVTGVAFSRNAATGRHIRYTTGEGLVQGPYVAAIGGVERTTFRTEGTDNIHLTNHAPVDGR